MQKISLKEGEQDLAWRWHVLMVRTDKQTPVPVVSLSKMSCDYIIGYTTLRAVMKLVRWAEAFTRCWVASRDSVQTKALLQWEQVQDLLNIASMLKQCHAAVGAGIMVTRALCSQASAQFSRLKLLLIFVGFAKIRVVSQLWMHPSCPAKHSWSLVWILDARGAVWILAYAQTYFAPSWSDLSTHPNWSLSFMQAKHY